jgi:hypothetical protein
LSGGAVPLLLNGSDSSKFIVRHVAGGAIKHGAATWLRFIKNCRLIVQKQGHRTPFAHPEFQQVISDFKHIPMYSLETPYLNSFYLFSIFLSLFSSFYIH